MSCEYTHLDGAYVLGALSPGERQEFEQHLQSCDACARSVRELAGLPGLLARVDRSVLEFEPAEEPVPPTLLPALVGEVRRRRRRNALVVAGAAAAAAVVAIGVPLLLSSGPDQETDRTPAVPQATASAEPSTTVTPAPVAMTTVGGAPVTGMLAFESVPWGTKLDLTCTYVKPAGGGFAGDHGYGDDSSGSGSGDAGPRKYEMFVHTSDGQVDKVGTWHAAEGATTRVSAATSATVDQIASVVVRTAEGQPVLRLDG